MLVCEISTAARSGLWINLHSPHFIPNVASPPSFSVNHESHPFLSNLEEIHGAESRIAVALSRMNKSDTSAELRREILSHLRDTEGNITGVENIHHHFCGRAGQEYLDSAELPDEAYRQDPELVSSLKSINDAGPPANGSQRGWEIASYGCLHAWEGLTDRIEAANFLEAMLEEERDGFSSSGACA